MNFKYDNIFQLYTLYTEETEKVFGKRSVFKCLFYMDHNILKMWKVVDICLGQLLQNIIWNEKKYIIFFNLFNVTLPTRLFSFIDASYTWYAFNLATMSLGHEYCQKKIIRLQANINMFIQSSKLNVMNCVNQLIGSIKFKICKFSKVWDSLSI